MTPIYGPTLDVIDWQSYVIISVARVSLPCYFSSYDYALLYILDLGKELFAIYLLVRAIVAMLGMQKTWECALEARGFSYLQLSPSPHTPVVHYKSFPILNSFLTLSECHHHPCSL